VISILTKRKSTATRIAIFMWFLFTVLSDLGFLSIVLNLKAGAAATLPVILLNPVETSRIFAVLSLGGAADQLGSTGLIISYYLGDNAFSILGGTLVAWLAVFFILAFLLFRRQDVV
ncbi:MAG: hypothetical protein E6K90_10255, partial [Thaumarchaeota archaeon]